MYRSDGFDSVYFAAERCLFCGRNFKDGRCPLCLAAPEFVPIDPQVTLMCPRCRKALVDLALGANTRLRSCSGCGGIFVDPTAWSALLAVESIGPLQEFAARNRESTRTRTAARVPCAACGTEMHRLRFDGTPIFTDVCARHGIWFDASEAVRAYGHVRTLEAGQHSFYSVPAPEKDDEPWDFWTPIRRWWRNTTRH